MSLLDTIEKQYAARLGKPLNLKEPKGYNEKIQWLKLYDQMPGHVTGCDKIAVRDVVAAAVGPEYLLEIFQIEDEFDRLNYRAPCMAKASHDSGSVARVTDRAGWERARAKIVRGMSRLYGLEKGEWGYGLVKPRCFTEQMMPGPVVDYKFHCVAGAIKWGQVIAERHTGHPVETITDPDGNAVPLHLDHQMRHSPAKIEIPATWGLMAEIAGELSRPFRYVRVDLYSVEARVYFGELTFWPKSGCYKTRDEPVFGDMLDFDMSFRRPAIVE